MTFVPLKKRCNVMIMDEPTANFSPETTEKFKSLIAVLNQVIPTIVIVTPRTDERYEKATEWTVLKEKGCSRIVRGHPSVV
jgi:ABC-type sugar transport system ATPase subunit